MKIVDLIRNTFDTLLYFAIMAVKENFRNYISRAATPATPSTEILILGNGPSLAEELPQIIERGDYLTKDMMVVNFFAQDDRFEQLKPKYYVLADPMFFRQSANQQQVNELYKVLNDKVSWPMNLYVQYYNPERFDYRAALENPLINIVPFHTQLYTGFRSIEFWLFRHGLGSANFGTVVQIGEYISLLLNYKKICLYGVDHTLLEGLVVDSQNRLCRADRHYYDTNQSSEPKQIFQKVPHRPYTMSIYLGELAMLFRGHETMHDYAKTLGARIINCTRNSQIDAYERE